MTILIFVSIEAQDTSQTLDELGALIEELLVAQNQSISKLNQLMKILETMLNVTGKDFYLRK